MRPRLTAAWSWFFMTGTLMITSALVTSSQAQQQYPVRPIRMIVPSAPGGGADITARVISPKLSEYLGQPVVVENKPGAGTMIGGEAVARANPDGYTLLMGISTLAINPTMYKKVPYDAIRDFAPISLVIALPNVLVVHPSLPVKSVKELIAYSEVRPGKINFFSAGLGTNPHLSMELFLNMTGLKMVHVPYKGSGSGIADLVSGYVQVTMMTTLMSLPYVKSGKLRALGVTSSQRATSAPDLPTIAEAGVPGYEAVQWFGVLAPAGTSRAIIDKIHAAIELTVKEPSVRTLFSKDGAEPAGSSPEFFSSFIRSETEKWSKVVRDAGIGEQ